MILYTPIGFETGADKKAAIFAEKNKIIRLAASGTDPFFIMKDADIRADLDDIPRMEQYLIENPGVGAVALWPHSGEFRPTLHVSSAFMMYRRDACQNWNPELASCFCEVVRIEMERRGFEITYIKGRVEQIRSLKRKAENENN